MELCRRDRAASEADGRGSSPSNRSRALAAMAAKTLALTACVWMATTLGASAQTAAASYRIDPRPQAPAELALRYTPTQIDILEMLNRRDRAHLIRTDPPTPG